METKHMNAAKLHIYTIHELVGYGPWKIELISIEHSGRSIYIAIPKPFRSSAIYVKGL